MLLFVVCLFFWLDGHRVYLLIFFVGLFSFANKGKRMDRSDAKEKNDVIEDLLLCGPIKYDLNQ